MQKQSEAQKEAKSAGTKTKIKSMKYYTYCHIRKDTNEVFYIGMCKNKRRPYSKEGRNHKWVEVVSKTEYSVEVLSEHDTIDEAFREEARSISEYRRICNGGTLTNMTDGGAGCAGLDADSKDRIRNAFLGIKRPKEFGEKVSASSKGKIISEATRAKISEALKKIDRSHIKRKQLSEETRRRMSEAQKGKPKKPGRVLSQNQKNLISKALRKTTDEQVSQAIALYKSGIKIARIAVILNISQTSVYGCLKSIKYEK